VSQIFDSLRDARQRSSRGKPLRTAQGDAVLATLGYAPSRRRGPRRIVRIGVLVVAVVGLWTGWRMYYSRPPLVNGRPASFSVR
jgi:hypothetical protein